MSIQEPQQIQTQALGVLADLRRAYADLVTHLPDEIQRPTDLQKALNVDYRVCWQVLSIIRSDDPLSVSHNVPTLTSLKRLLAASMEKGVPPHIVHQVEDAMRAFNALVTDFAADRKAFDVMLASVTGGDAAETLSIQHRRNAFRSNSPIWGVQMDTALNQLIVRRSADGNGTDECTISMKHGLRVLRQNVTPAVYGHREPPASPDGATKSPNSLPLDPQAKLEYGTPILPQFCSQPMPRFNSMRTDDGWDLTVVDAGQLGRKGVSFSFGGVALNVPFKIDSDGRRIVQTGMLPISPVGVAISEMFIHRPSLRNAVPQFRVFAQATGGSYAVPGAIRHAQSFEFHEKVVALGSVRHLVSVTEVPRYPDLVNHAFNLLKWDPAEFDVYRVRVQYPVMHTMLQLWFAVD